MRKNVLTLLALALSIIMIFSFTACTATEDDEEETIPVGETINVGGNIPVSETEIIAFFNNIVSAVQNDNGFAAERRPGIKTGESLSVNNIKVLQINENGETVESGDMESINKSAKTIKDRILSGIDTSVPIVPFGDTTGAAADVIYPAGTADVLLKSEYVKSAECSVDGYNLKIDIVLTDSADAIENIFGIRNKSEVIESFNKESNEFAEIKDYSVVYVDDDESNTHSTISLAVEVEKQEDGSYKCTGRISSLKYTVISDITADVVCKGSFEKFGNANVQLRLKDEKSYDFDWLGTATWEPYFAEK